MTVSHQSSRSGRSGKVTFKAASFKTAKKTFKSMRKGREVLQLISALQQKKSELPEWEDTGVAKQLLPLEGCNWRTVTCVHPQPELGTDLWPWFKPTAVLQMLRFKRNHPLKQKPRFHLFHSSLKVSKKPHWWWYFWHSSSSKWIHAGMLMHSGVLNTTKFN